MCYAVRLKEKAMCRILVVLWINAHPKEDSVPTKARVIVKS